MTTTRAAYSGLALAVCAVPLELVARTVSAAPNGADLLAVLAALGGIILGVVRTARARDAARAWPTRLRRGRYRLEFVGGLYVFGDDRAKRAVPVSGADLVVLRRFIDGDALYTPEDSAVIGRYLDRVAAGVAA